MCCHWVQTAGPEVKELSELSDPLSPSRPVRGSETAGSAPQQAPSPILGLPLCLGRPVFKRKHWRGLRWCGRVFTAPPARMPAWPRLSSWCNSPDKRNNTLLAFFILVVHCPDAPISVEVVLVCLKSMFCIYYLAASRLKNRVVIPIIARSWQTSCRARYVQSCLLV